MKTKFLLCLFLVSSLSFVSCSSDDGGSGGGNGQFTDKWWYSPEDETLDLYFDSDGSYESVFLFGGNNVTSSGEWEWVDESAKIVRVFNLQGNATGEYYGKISNLDGDSMSIRMSLDQGETYTEPYPYVDTND